MITVRALEPGDWELARDLRLAALQDEPNAFGSTYAVQVAYDEAQWRQRLANSHTFAAWYDDKPVGLIGGFVEPDGKAHLISMWVRPGYRGRGISDRLIETVLDWAKELGVSDIRLWVGVYNTPAQRLYERNGFVPTGVTGPLPTNPDIMELEMIRSL